jgi:hypothetical protein
MEVLLVDLKEAARIMGGVHVRTITRMADRGQLKTLRLSKRRRLVLRSSIEKLVGEKCK